MIVSRHSPDLLQLGDIDEPRSRNRDSINHLASRNGLALLFNDDMTTHRMQPVRSHDQIRLESLATLRTEGWNLWFDILDSTIEMDLASSLCRTFKESSMEVRTVDVPGPVKRIWNRGSQQSPTSKESRIPHAQASSGDILQVSAHSPIASYADQRAQYRTSRCIWRSQASAELETSWVKPEFL